MAADIAIVICTYLRPEPLARALRSVFALRRPAGLTVEIVVVDNSDASTARESVSALGGESPVPLRYVEAHPPNISVARNAGLAAAAGARAVAFLDDDQEVDGGWLEAVSAGLAAHPHDVFFGRVVPRFETPEQASPAIRNLFSRDIAAPDGTELFVMGPAKTPGVALGTNNSIFRARALEGAAFDPAFGDAGGEDYDLFCRLQARGVRFGWLSAACAVEDVPAARCDAGYLRRRLYAGGQAYAAAVARTASRPALARWKIRAKAALQAALLGASGPVQALRGRDARLDHGFRWAGVVGKLSFGGLYPVYREGDPKRAPTA